MKQLEIRRFPRLATGPIRAQISNDLVKQVAESINKQYKKTHKKSRGAVSVLGESIFAMPKYFAPSGILPVDAIVCYGQGFPLGIIEIYGAESTSKTALLENVFAASQKVGYHTGMFPMEFSLDSNRARTVGIDKKKLLIFEEAETIEDIYEMILLAVRKIREVDKSSPIVIGIDTIASTPTRAEQKYQDIEKSGMGDMARQMSKLFRRLVKFLIMNRVCLFCINQTRENLAVRFGNKETTSGGKALRFYSWVRCRMRREKKIVGPNGKAIGMVCIMETIKNKVAPPFQSCRLPIYYNRGIDSVEAVWYHCVDQEIFKQKGVNYRFKGKVVKRRTFPTFYHKYQERIDAAILAMAKL